MGYSRKKLDLTGQRYGRLVVLRPAENIGGRTAWLCRCDCGREKVVKTSRLRSGHTSSCGCMGPGAAPGEGLRGLTYVDGTCVEMLRTNVDTIGQDAFYSNVGLETVKMGSVNTISQYAFRNCANLTAINSLKDVGRINGFAFYGCKNLSGLTVEDLTKMGFNGNYGDVMDRVQAILSGKFKLDAAPGIVEITPEKGWDDSTVGRSENWNTYDSGTQLVEQARWTNEDKTEAEVKVDAYYTAPKQMDYIFVADLSASMAQMGNPADMNSRFYDMQSKLLDMSGQLLGSQGYDCRVAIVTFGGALDADNPDSSNIMAFTESIGDAKSHINSLEPLYENTGYGLGMQEALKLAQNNIGRNTVVIFLSDGAPNQNGSGDRDGTIAAAGIKALNVPIYGVLHSPESSAYSNALAKMQAVCSAIPGQKTVFESTNTEEFGEAMNDAFTAVYPNYTVAIPVNESFENARELETSVSAGEAAYDKDAHTITWTIKGMPFTKHTLTYRMSLTGENASLYGEQSYPVNNGSAFIQDGASTESPVLYRVRNLPDTYTLTVRYVYADGREAFDPVIRGSLREGDSYAVASPGLTGLPLIRL